jgi:hypothetical protein
LHRTWAHVGCQPSIDTYGQRRTAHLYGTIGLKDASFTYWFAVVFNGHTFWAFLKRLVSKYEGRKIFGDYRQRALAQPSVRGQAMAWQQSRKDCAVSLAHLLTRVQPHGASLESNTQTGNAQSVLR